MIRFLADENFPTSAVQLLRSLGYDIERIGDASPGIADGEIALRAATDDRIILTSDKNFGRSFSVLDSVR